MPTRGSITKTVRITERDTAYLTGLMDEMGLSWSGAVHWLISESQIKKSLELGVEPKRQDLMDKAVERELRRQCRAYQISTHDLFREISRLLDKGRIRVDGDKLRTFGRLNTEKFEEECYKNGLKPQEIVDKLTAKIMRG